MIKKHSNKGFTILELTLVLGIAGAILLIVLVAIPALQRNNKNTQYRQEVARLVAAVGEYTTNNNGNIPKNLAEFQAASAFANLRDIDSTKLEVVTGVTAITDWSDQSIVKIRVGARCNTNIANIKTPLAGSARQLAFYYVVEGSDGATNIIQCSQS